MALLVNDNQQVKAGDVLIRIDDRDFVTARDHARGALEIAKAQRTAAALSAAIARKTFPARLLQAQGQLQQAQGQLFQAETDYKRQHAVARAATTPAERRPVHRPVAIGAGPGGRGPGDGRQAEPVQDNINQADQQVSQIDGQIKQAEAQLAQAELNLGYTEIHAPQDGWITKRNVEWATTCRPARRCSRS